MSRGGESLPGCTSLSAPYPLSISPALAFPSRTAQPGRSLYCGLAIAAFYERVVPVYRPPVYRAERVTA